MHQCFDCISILCSCEFLALCLTSGNYRDCKNILCKVSVDSPHLFCTLFCFFVCCMDCMSFLPQELSRTKEWSCCLLPAKNGTPLIPHLRKITVRLNCLAPDITEQCLRCRTDTESFLKFFQSTMCYPCNFRCKSFDMILFFLKKAFRDHNRKVYILYSCLFETCIQVLLNILPQSISVRKVVHTSFNA